jgi:hypothetical protein
MPSILEGPTTLREMGQRYNNGIVTPNKPPNESQKIQTYDDRRFEIFPLVWKFELVSDFGFRIFASRRQSHSYFGIGILFILSSCLQSGSCSFHQRQFRTG